MPIKIDESGSGVYLDDYIDENDIVDLNRIILDQDKGFENYRKLIIEVNFENEEKIVNAKHQINNLVDEFIKDCKEIDGYVNTMCEYSMTDARYGLENTLKAGTERLLAQDKGGLVIKNNYQAFEAIFKEIWKSWPDKDQRGSQTKFINHIINNPDSKAPKVSSRTLQKWIKNWKTEQA